MSTHNPPLRYANRLPQKRLWFGTAAGAAAWALQGFTCFLISTQACKYGAGRLGPLGGPGVRILIGAVTLVFLAITVIGGMTSYRNWKAISEQRSLTHAEALNREAFMSLIGVFLSVTFVIAIIWAGLTPIFENVCINAR